MSDSNAQPTVVIVEDDPDVRHLLVDVFEAAGFSTVSVGNGIDGVRAVLTYQPLVTTLDVNMPGIDGYEAARRIRKESTTHIILISGLSEEADAVLGLGAGADDYIIKPFRPRELRARIDAVLRRSRSEASQPRSEPLPQHRPQETVGPSFPNARPVSAPAQSYEQAQPAAAGAPSADTYILHPATAAADSTELAIVAEEFDDDTWMAHRDLRLNPDTRIAVIGGHEVDLTRTEFDLLAALLESKRRVRSKADLTLLLRGESYVTSYFVGDADKRAIEAHMTNLRRKIGDSSTAPRYIETVRGVGYRLTSESVAQ